MCALFTDTTPYAVLVATLLAGGLARSLFFTSTNALTFSGIDKTRAAQATAIAAVAQQVSIALGVALAGLILETAAFVTGADFTRTDFAIAFATVALVALSSVLPFLRLPASIGADMSGHKAKQADGQPSPS